MPKRKRMMN
jgi:hypothetical protein